MSLGSGMSIIKRQKQYESLQKEADRILADFTVNPERKHRATIKVARRLILNGPYVIQGRYRDIKSKSIGAGVYELRTVEVME